MHYFLYSIQAVRTINKRVRPPGHSILSDPANCQKHQATIDALKQVAREAQLKLSKKTKDYERLLLTTAPAQPEILELKMPIIIIHL